MQVCARTNSSITASSYRVTGIDSTKSCRKIRTTHMEVFHGDATVNPSAPDSATITRLPIVGCAMEAATDAGGQW